MEYGYCRISTKQQSIERQVSPLIFFSVFLSCVCQYR